MGVRLLGSSGGVEGRIGGSRSRCSGGRVGGELGVHGVGLLEGEEVHVGGAIGHDVGLDTQVEEKPQDVDILGQVIR